MENKFQKELEKIKKQHEKKAEIQSTSKGTDKYYSEEEAVEKIYFQLLDNAHFPQKFKNATFNNFDLDFIPENKKKVNSIKAYAKNIHHALNRAQSILIYSQGKGTGKTHVAIAAGKLALYQYAKNIYRKNPTRYSIRGINDNFLKYYRPVFFFSEQNYLWKKKKFYTENKEILNEVEVIENAIINTDLLIIDDLFKSRDTDFTFDELTNWLCQRYDQNKAVILTTNLNYKLLKADKEENPFRSRLDEAQFLYSRIEEMTKGYQFMFKDNKDYREEGVL